MPSMSKLPKKSSISAQVILAYLTTLIYLLSGNASEVM